jgi:UPF0716 protein FxsA
LALLLAAVVEIAVFVVVAKVIGLAWAILLALAFSVCGMVLLGREGRRGWQRMREAARGGAPAGRQAADGVAGMIAALLLVVPGFVTGVVGLLLLVPPLRSVTAGRIRAATEKRVPSHVAGDLFGPRQVRVQRTPRTTEPSTTEEVIEGEIVD